ncbi:MAG: dephospho-CoA kinase [Cyclobacteriaceae bacterium]|jgi:dephospho-CoA kinase
MFRALNWTLPFLKLDIDKNMSVKVGITGGIGAGKSLVANIFRTFGIPVYNSDTEAKRLMNEDPYLKEQIINLFGPKAYTNNTLNRTYLNEVVFKNHENLNRMNNLVHPAVIKDYNSWLTKYIEKSMTIKEAALLFESNSYMDLDYTILVSAPKSIRIGRVLLRDANRSKEDIENIIEKQMSESRKKKLSDFIIINDGKMMVIPQVLKIYESLTHNQ